MNEFNDEDFIRSFEEFDEKLPAVAKVIVGRGIDFARLQDDEVEESEADREVCRSVLAIFREMVECTSEMTTDELEHYIAVLVTACELVALINDGIVCEKEKGKFSLTQEGKALFRGTEFCGEESIDQAGNGSPY